MISQLIKGLSVLVPGFLQRWAKVPYVLAQTGIPVGIAPACTVGANGALSGLTALTTIYSGGIWLYFGAGALYAGSEAGIYWCVMSSTTAGTAYNTTLTGWPSIPASPTPIVDAGPGAYAGTTTEVSLVSTTLPANSLGPNGSITIDLFFLVNNSAGQKNPKVYLGASFTSNPVYLLNILAGHFNYRIFNSGLNGKQKWIFPSYGGGQSTLNTAENLGIDNAVKIAGQLATATDYMILSGVSMDIRP